MSNLVIVMSEALQKKVRLYADVATGEISWIGEIELIGKNQIVVKDLFLIEQDTEPSKAELRKIPYKDFLMSRIRAGKDLDNLKFQEHSHGFCGVCWSFADETTIEGHDRADYYVSIVTNKRGELLARVDIFSPLRVTIHDVPVVTQYHYSQAEIATAKRDIAKLVHYHEPKPIVVKGVLTDELIETE